MTDPRASAGRLPPPTWEALDDWLGSVRERALASPAGGEAAASDPEVTISMPARNTAPMIGVALRSVLDQSGPSVEVIVVDDGSDDETATVAEGTGDPRVQVIRLERSRGIGAGHNLVTRHARGRFIVHVDSDDVVLPGGIEGAVAPLRARPELVHTYSDFFDLAVDGSIDEASYHEQLGRFDRRYQSGVDVRRELLVHGMVANHLRAYRKSALEEVGGFGETLVHGEDWAMAVVLASRYEIAPTGAWLYARRVRDSSISGGAEMTPLRFWWDHLPIVRRLLDEHGGTLCGFDSSRVGMLTALRGLYATGLVDLIKRGTRTARR